MTTTHPASATIASTLDRDGFVVVERVLNESQLAAASAGVEWVVRRGQGLTRWIHQRTYEWHREHPIFVELIEHPFVIDIAHQMLGDDFHLIAAQCSRNTRDDPYAPGAMSIHQDGVFFPKKVPDGVPAHRIGFSAMWYVQDTPLEMGPTQFVRQSHVSADLLTDGTIPADRLFSRAIPAGSLAIFLHRTWHRGRNNTTPQPRDLITNAYARRCVAKVQLAQKLPDGSERYVPDQSVIENGSALLRQLFQESARTR